MKRILFTLLSSALLAVVHDAQSVTFRGKVEDVSGTNNLFFVDCTSTQLTSLAFNLNSFVGQQVAITGDWNGSFAAPSVNVTSIAPALETYEIGGGADIGDFSNQSFVAAPGTFAVGLLSLGSSFAPFQGGNGVIFLDPTRVVLTQTGVVGGSGILEIPFFIPNDPALIGIDLIGQGALLSAGAAPLLTNPDCKEIDD
ncbi:MAG: hypothetical protein WD226_01430 [Planctomycetota bacterium]